MLLSSNLFITGVFCLSLSRRRPLSYRNQSIDFHKNVLILSNCLINVPWRKKLSIFDRFLLIIYHYNTVLSSSNGTEKVTLFFINKNFIRTTSSKLVKNKNILRTLWEGEVQTQKIAITMIYDFLENLFMKVWHNICIQHQFSWSHNQTPKIASDMQKIS